MGPADVKLTDARMGNTGTGTHLGPPGQETGWLHGLRLWMMVSTERGRHIE